MGHWYERDGTPRHLMPKASGKGMRGTTIRDARANNLWPSVTGILGVLDKPGLNNWRVTNAVLEAETLSRREGETSGQFVYRCEKAAREHTKAAADRGTAIHNALEAWTVDGIVDDDYFEIIRAVHVALKELVPGFDELEQEAERTLCHQLGFGGKTDLILPSIPMVIDYKTKDFDSESIEKVRGYDDQGMQLAAYAGARGLYPWQGWGENAGGESPRLVNIFVSRSSPGLVKVYEHEDSERLWEAFEACCQLYHAMNPGLRDKVIK